MKNINPIDRSSSILFQSHKHWIKNIGTFFIISIAFVSFVSLGIVAYIFSLIHGALLVIYVLFIFNLFYYLLLKVLIDWKLNFVTVFDEQIVETRCSPLLFCNTTQILLNKVITTEIDVKVKNPLQELFDVGEVSLLFDEFSHERTLKLEYIKKPREVADLLRKAFDKKNGYIPTSISNRYGIYSNEKYSARETSAQFSS